VPFARVPNFHFSGYGSHLVPFAEQNNILTLWHDTLNLFYKKLLNPFKAFKCCTYLMSIKSETDIFTVLNMNYSYTDFVTTSLGITAVPGMVPASISFIKRKRTTEKEVYLLKAWVKDIEPPVHSKCFSLDKSVIWAIIAC
jgi:hypothetical protein